MQIEGKAALTVIEPMLRPAAAGRSRDVLLDMCKGMAIILVVLGHTLQGRTANFDDTFGFRFIYSFHMPLFVFLAGASARYWIRKLDASVSFLNLTVASLQRIKRSAVHLLLPFFSWTVITYLMVRSEELLMDFLLKVFLQPDVSLWFLPAIFWCIVYASIMMVFVSVVRKIAADTPIAAYLARPSVQSLVMLLLWISLRHLLPASGGLAFANNFHHGLFAFFLLGVACYEPFVKIRSAWLRLIPYAIFLALVPYWHRTLPKNLVEDAPYWLMRLGSGYAVVVAICGTLVFVDISRWIGSLGISVLNRSFSYLGVASLAIYAVHFYFVGYEPVVVFPILVSIALYWLIMHVPGVRKMLFG